MEKSIAPKPDERTHVRAHKEQGFMNGKLSFVPLQYDRKITFSHFIIARLNIEKPPRRDNT